MCLCVRIYIWYILYTFQNRYNLFVVNCVVVVFFMFVDFVKFLLVI